jgi:hypothetical protein
MAEKKTGGTKMTGTTGSLSAAARKRQSPPQKSMAGMKRNVAKMPRTGSKPVPLGGVKKPSVPAKNTGGAQKRTAKKMTPTNIKGFANGRKTV